MLGKRSQSYTKSYTQLSNTESGKNSFVQERIPHTVWYLIERGHVLNIYTNSFTGTELTVFISLGVCMYVSVWVHVHRHTHICTQIYILNNICVYIMNKIYFQKYSVIFEGYVFLIVKRQQKNTIKHMSMWLTTFYFLKINLKNVHKFIRIFFIKKQN